MINFADEVNQYLKKYFECRGSDIQKFSPKLLESMEYSLNNGGKRFRPSLCLHTADLLGVERSKVLPYAAALEMIHTYSLIHDDLPCMDNDDERRGQPTNHVRYGEPLALLAGDGLLTEAFTAISENYSAQPAQGVALVRALSRAAGGSGMVGGQAMDMGLGQPMEDLKALLHIHTGKTAALIAAAVEGAGIIAGLGSEHAQTLRFVGEQLGIAFQVKDDLLDNETTPNSVLYYWDKNKAESYLQELYASAQTNIKKLPASCEKLLEFFKYNQERSV